MTFKELKTYFNPFKPEKRLLKKRIRKRRWRRSR